MPGAPAALSPQSFKAFYLYRVAGRGSRGVALYQVHLGRREAGLAIGRAHRIQLARGVRRKQAAAYVVGKAYAGYDPVNLVAVAHCVREALKDEHPGALADYQPVCGGVKRGRPARGREGAQLGKTHLGIKAGRAGDSASNHSVGAPGANGVCRHLYSVKRRGASGVQGEAAS